MTDDDLQRYARHILLDEISIEGQERINVGKVLVVGVGGLGNPCSVYLASAGVGTIVLCDADSVDATNLQRQILFTKKDVGQPKVVVAAARLKELNPSISIETLFEKFTEANADELVRKVDVVVDCTDNFTVRHLINRACFRLDKPLVSGSAIRFDGQVSVFNFPSKEGCYACLVPEDSNIPSEKCALMGVFAPLTGLIGSLQAIEVLKLLGKFGAPLVKRGLYFDTSSMSVRSLNYKPRISCSVCSV